MGRSLLCLCEGRGRNKSWLSGLTLIQKCVSRLLLSGRENRGAVVHGGILPAWRAPKQEGGCTGTCVGGSGCASANGSASTCSRLLLPCTNDSLTLPTLLLL